jgi:Sigma-70 region 2.
VKRPVTLSERVAEYRPLCNSLARRFSGPHSGAELDDLEQEGLIAVWLLLDRGLPVSKTAIKNRMRDWARYCRRRGFTYEELPTDE